MDNKIIIVNDEHLGIVLWGLGSMKSVMKNNAERLRKYGSYTVGWDNEAYAFDYINRHDPDFLEEIKLLLKEYPDRFEINSCTYGQPLSTFIGEESNVRQLTYGVKTLEKYFGFRPRVYIMSEHAMHAQIPALLKSSGYRGAFMRTHFMMYGCNPEINEPSVLWQGLDGTLIKTIPTYENNTVAAVKSSHSNKMREAPFGDVTWDNRILTDGAGEMTLEAMAERINVHPVVASKADDPRQPEDVVDLYNDSKRVVWSTAEKALDLLPDADVKFDVQPEDFSVRMPWGLIGNRIFQKTRQLECALISCHGYDSLRRVFYNDADCAEYENAWCEQLVLQHHDIQILGLEEEAQKHIDIIERSLKGGGEYLFNPLPYATEHQGIIINGFESVSIPEDEQPAVYNGLFFETAYFMVSVNPCGGFDSIVMKSTGLKVLKAGSGKLRGKINGVDEVSVSTVNVYESNIEYIVKEELTIGSIYGEITWKFSKASPDIDFESIINMDSQLVGRTGDKGDATSAFIHEEKLRVVFILDEGLLEKGFYDRPFAGSLTDDSYIEGNYMAGVCGKSGAMAVYNKGIMCVVKEDNCAVSVPLIFSMHYVWDANNYGVTRGYDGMEDAVNSQQRPSSILKGEFSHCIRLGFFETYNFSEIYRKAVKYAFPPIRVKEKKDIPLNISLTPNVQISGIYEENGKLYLRVFENAGLDGRFSVLNSGASLALVDLRHNPISKEFCGPAHIHPYEIGTFVINNLTL